MIRRATIPCLLLGLLLENPASAQEADPKTQEPDAPAWCAPEFETLEHATCYAAPPEGIEARTLVIFLHGVIQPKTDWQWAQQRSIARAASKAGAATIMPRGRRGIGPKGMEDWWTWPTSVKAQRSVEGELIGEWQAARQALETRAGKKFERVLVVGFSNGAYYAGSLALLGKLSWVGGYGIFAGGAGAKYLTGPAKHTRHRPPIYVGYGLKDKAHKDPKGLARALKSLGWDHRVGVRGVGHTMADSQLAELFAYVGKPGVKRSE